jgi:hypothetical protein
MDIIIEKKYNCEKCKYSTDTKLNWLYHLDSNKHKRGGKLLTDTCSECNYVATNHWNLKYHIASQHSTIEERKKQKYYCNICDTVFFCKLYMDKHNEGKKHKKMLLSSNKKIDGINNKQNLIDEINKQNYNLKANLEDLYKMISNIKVII